MDSLLIEAHSENGASEGDIFENASVASENEDAASENADVYGDDNAASKNDNAASKNDNAASKNDNAASKNEDADDADVYGNDNADVYGNDNADVYGNDNADVYGNDNAASENKIISKKLHTKKSPSYVSVDPIIVKKCEMISKSKITRFLQEEYNIDSVDIFSVNVVVPRIIFNNLKNSHLGISIMNSIRRVLTDELKHCHFTLDKIIIDENNTDLKDEYISKEYLALQLSNLPLIYGAKQKIKSNNFSLDVTNTSTTKMIICCNKLNQGSNIILDPTGEICTLNPGKRITFSNLEIKDNYGYKFGGATLTSNARYRYLDIEIHSLEEMNMPENRLKPFAHESCYAQSSLLATPLAFELVFNIKSASNDYLNEANIILRDSANNIIERLKKILIILSQYVPGENNIHISESPNSDNGRILYTIKLLDETNTIGALIVSLIYTYTAIYNLSDENELSILIYLPSEIDGIKYILDSIKYGVDLYKEIRDQFK
jgi:hypothetical protein